MVNGLDHYEEIPFSNNVARVVGGYEILSSI
jgi:hypothetical protein